MGGSTLVTNIIFIVIIAAMIVFMWMSSRKQRKQQQAEVEWREHLKKGDKVSTVSGLLGEIVSADAAHDQVTIKSGNSVSVWRIQAIRRPPVIPHYADEDQSASSDKSKKQQEGHPSQADGAQSTPRLQKDASHAPTAPAQSASEENKPSQAKTAPHAESSQKAAPSDDASKPRN